MEDEFVVLFVYMMCDWDGWQDLWLFGYGLLIWNFGLLIVVVVCGKVYGYYCGFYLWLCVNCGIFEWLGFVFVFDCGGLCLGIVFWFFGLIVQLYFEMLWKCEMLMGLYWFVWLLCLFEIGECVNVFVFVMCCDVLIYMGKLIDFVVKEVFSCVVGCYGMMFDYVSCMVDVLCVSGIFDCVLEGLLV